MSEDRHPLSNDDIERFNIERFNIERFNGTRKAHFFDPNAKRADKPLGDLTGDRAGGLAHTARNAADAGAR